MKPIVADIKRKANIKKIKIYIVLSRILIKELMAIEKFSMILR